MSNIDTIWNCEIEEFNRQKLNNNFPNTKQYSDIKDLLTPEKVNIISGGFPCQDISIANTNATGIKGKRSGLWSEMYRVIRYVRPEYVIIENSPMLLVRGFEQVLFDLSKIGYDAEWHSIPASAVGAHHARDRIWVVAYPAGPDQHDRIIRRRDILCGREADVWGAFDCARARMVDGFSNRPHRLKALGNAVVPQIPELIGRAILSAQAAA